MAEGALQVGRREAELRIIQQHLGLDVPAMGAAAEEWCSSPELPTPQEMLASDKELEMIGRSLPHNNIQKPWGSSNEYLRAHYLLSREDGKTNLRFGIRQFRKNPQMQENEQVCIYTKVYAKAYELTNEGPICRLEFTTERTVKKIKWNHTRRLTPGTLVVLSPVRDNFKTICKVATIADRSVENGLDKNPHEIGIFWADIKDAVLDPNEELVMLESRYGYYEAVRHTMVGLQHSARFPSVLLNKYLVKGVLDDDSPRFINKETFICTVDKRLDKSQREALLRIVTKELAIIQGPPGTGKTFTFVEALKVLNGLQGEGTSPIIVAAQTNHALDQLLLRIDAVGIRVLRLGRRTTGSPHLEQLTLYKQRQLWIKNDKDFDKGYRDLQSARRKNGDKLQALVNQIMPKNSVLNPIVLHEAGLITKQQLDSLLADPDLPIEQPEDPFSAMLEWLGPYVEEAQARRYADRLFDLPDDVDADEELEEDFEDVVMIDDKEVALRGRKIHLEYKYVGKAHLASPAAQLEFQLRQCDDLWRIRQDLRGSLYNHLRTKLLEKHRNELCGLLKEAHQICRDKKIHKYFKDLQLIKRHGIEVVGCTTTGLTKYRAFLAAMQPSTMLIEEAAETREANIAAAMYPSLQQLVLVGDHQQLRPHCDTAALGKHPYNLTISMFERLVNLDLPFVMLSSQRRMSPRIREVVQQFYPELADHPSVLPQNRDNQVRGIAPQHASYFFDHEWEDSIDSNHSSMNPQEADMVVNFLAYLVQNGHSLTRITILTFYRGQRKLIIRKGQRNALLSGHAINVHTVDSFQGEENDIVLLSLVRSAPKHMRYRAGFLEDKNRGVVSISRARIGFFIFGNINNLEWASDASWFMWGPVADVFRSQKREGRSLPLTCQNHGRQTQITDLDDWLLVNGGCTKACGGLLRCGHSCKLKCHPLDSMPHEKMKCSKHCEKQLPCGHKCRNPCYEVCRCYHDCYNQIRTQKTAEGQKRREFESLEDALAEDDEEFALQTRSAQKTYAYSQQASTGQGVAPGHSRRLSSSISHNDNSRGKLGESSAAASMQALRLDDKALQDRTNAWGRWDPAEADQKHYHEVRAAQAASQRYLPTPALSNPRTQQGPTINETWRQTALSSSGKRVTCQEKSREIVPERRHTPVEDLIDFGSDDADDSALTSHDGPTPYEMEVLASIAKGRPSQFANPDEIPQWEQDRSGEGQQGVDVRNLPESSPDQPTTSAEEKLIDI